MRKVNHLCLLSWLAFAAGPLAAQESGLLRVSDSAWDRWHADVTWRDAPVPVVHTLQSEDPGSSVWAEVGYVLAMETVFTGMSFLGSRPNRWGPAVTGAFDLFMAGAGVNGASHKEPGIQKTGHYAISAGFAAKSLYNLYWGRDHSSSAQFWTNLVGYNVLVFFGYFLDTL